MRRRGLLDLLAGGELHSVLLFAVDRAGHAGGRRRGRVVFGIAHRALLAQQEAWELVTFEGEGDKAPIAYYDNGLVLA